MGTHHVNVTHLWYKSYQKDLIFVKKIVKNVASVIIKKVEKFEKSKKRYKNSFVNFLI